MALCPECDEALHLEFPNERAAAVMSQHKVVDIKNKKTKFGKCRDHDRKFEFYCLTCHRPICVNCKIVGNHAGVELNNHWIIDIDKAYQRAKEEVEDDDPALKKKLSQINQQMDHIKEKMQGLKQNAEEIENDIYALLRETLNQLKDEFRRKSSLLKSDLVELERIVREINYSNEYIQKQAIEIEPIDFLELWAGNNQHKTKLIKKRPTVSDVQIDLKLDGKPIIISDNS